MTECFGECIADSYINDIEDLTAEIQSLQRQLAEVKQERDKYKVGRDECLRFYKALYEGHSVKSLVEAALPHTLSQALLDSCQPDDVLTVKLSVKKYVALNQALAALQPQRESEE